ncbi:MAG: hypothetical protein ABNH38_04900 [Tateyamaria sp.]|jgi:hypothetical protein|uniref:hypothetical protein n=1 Tax=Tateyamaria sp. TaxID=1929288 RepID=UPI0032DCC650
MEQAEIDELQSAIAIARKRPLNFAICLGKKPETSVMTTHRAKAADILARKAKKEGETSKLAFGQMEVKGKLVMLSCEAPPPAGAAKKIRDFLGKAAGIKMKVVLMDGDGAILEDSGEADDGAEEPAEPTSEAVENTEDQGAPAAEAVDPDAARWDAIFAKLNPIVTQAATAGQGDVSKLRAVWAFATEAADGGAYAKAIAAAGKIKDLLPTPQATPTQDAPASDPRWDKVAGAAQTLLGKVLSTKPRNAENLQAAWQVIDAKAESGAVDAAIKASKSFVAKLRAMLDAAGPDSDMPDTGTGIPEGLVKRRGFLMTRWQKIPTELNAQIKRLENAMMAEVPDEDPKKLTASVQVALDAFCDDMQDALDDAINSGDSTYGTAITLLDTFKTRVQSDKLIQHLKSNPFDDAVDVESVLISAMDEIKQALAA